ncbi:MAG: ABC transporter permease, partial [Vicinamibacteria bacterium]
METLWQDIVHSIRRLRGAPVFALVAIATLALGIGANSAIFSIVNAVVFKPLPFPEPERLMAVGVAHGQKNFIQYVSPMNFLDIQAASQTFQAMAAFTTGGATLTDQGAAATLRWAGVSSSFFDTIGIRPSQGRGFLPDENEPAKSLVAVLGYDLWKNRFGGDPAIIGKKIRIESQLHEVVGIAPPGLSFPEGIEVWTPLRHDERFLTKSRGAWYLTVVGRLKGGVSEESACQEIATIVARLAAEYADANEGLSGRLMPLHELIVGDSRSGLMFLLGAVGLVLLIACVNVANLMLGRLAAREAEFAVRQAMGASRVRVFRQLMTESLVLAAVGGASGLMLASASLRTLIALRPADVPRLDQAVIDLPVLLFAIGTTLITAVLFGAMPALRAWRPEAMALREGGRGLSSARSGRVRNLLVVGQMALAMMLLAGAGLLARSFTQLQSVKPGFDTSRALTFSLSLPAAAYTTEESRAAFFDRLIPRLEALPGAGPAAATLGLPLNRTRFNISFEIRDNPPLTPAQQPSMEMRPVTSGYFKAMGIPIVRGRGFEMSDALTSPQVVVITDAAAKKYFPNENPVGRYITMGYGRQKGKPAPGGEIVGVVADVKDRGLAFDAWPEIYLPYAQLPIGSVDVLLRTQGDPMALAKSVEAAVHEIDRELPLGRVRSFDALLAASISQPRFYALLLGFFAVVAVSLAALGIFGVMSYSVVQRSREIGVRLALGANPGTVRMMVLRQAMALALAGVFGGVLGALAFSQTISSLLFQLSPTDPSTLLGVAVLLSVVAFVASYLPAHQATRV